MIKIINAETAKRRTNKVIKEMPLREFEHELEKVAEIIEEGIEQGLKRKACVSPYSEVIEHLQKLGYKVEKDKDWHSHIWWISWE